ncbi:hypothetical protein CFOLD11_11640 [Clostridium folliculivorans]|uniref:GIY-YIG domain-containing protein n=1 Tax=Clostridium folliculivorans TaxID=2886038 RepID=A0A9W5Y0G8_9CLOT|nr:hypothetical protein [Clostridium folliculivorans]GKU24338.1 hypothetical protein CFOLD11_11640 [Clostridium folliculivorans]
MGSYYKKIDKSVLESGKITIPDDEINLLLDVSKMNVGESIDLILQFNNRKYKGKIAYKNRNSKKNKGKPYYQLTYELGLTKELKKEFIQTFLAIETEKISCNESEKYHITSDNINREVVKFQAKHENLITVSPFLKIGTEYDRLFQKIIEMNLLDLDKNDKEKDIISYSSTWIPISDLNKHKEVKNVVYYLVDTINKEVYIGSAHNLGKRVKPNREEIPGWNIFKYEVINPKYTGLLVKIEYHSIRAFASFLDNVGGESSLGISEYKLNNKVWSKCK